VGLHFLQIQEGTLTKNIYSLDKSFILFKVYPYLNATFNSVRGISDIYPDIWTSCQFKIYSQNFKLRFQRFWIIYELDIGP